MRLRVLKTYKLFIGGQFPRSESGRTFELADANGRLIANVARGSRKDLRDAVVQARAAFQDWSRRSGYNRGQILYRLAELVEGRRDQFVAELRQQGSRVSDARREVDRTIDQLIYYAGWGDKYQSLFSTVNPVASPHFVFSMPEPTGVVAVVAPAESALLGLVAAVSPVVIGGNCVVALAAEKKPLSSITFSEVCAAGDLPAGVINILTGFRAELIPPLASHMDINAIVACGTDASERKTIQQQASQNVKRVLFPAFASTASARRSPADDFENPYLILDAQEIKTTWHPVGD